MSKEITNSITNSDDWNSAVEAAQVVKSADEINWDETADLVVIGFGGAGAATALHGLEKGLSVIAVDRFDGGGATTKSGGVIYAGGGTPVQQEAGLEDTPENMFNYLVQETNGIVSDETLRDFCNESAGTIGWLQEHGVKFGATVWHEKTSYPGPEYFLYHSDNSLTEKAKKTAYPAARGHRGYVPIEQGRKAQNLGDSIYEPMKQAALQRGLTLLTYSEVRQLVQDESGNVLGARVLRFDNPAQLEKYQKLRARATWLMMVWPPILPGFSFFMKQAFKLLAKAQQMEGHRTEKYIRAKKGLTLSAGGFVFNSAMVNQYAPKYHGSFPLGTDGDDGAGIRLGQTAGGKADNMQRVTAWRFINPPMSFGRGIIVNLKGERFINEMVYGATLGVEMAENHDGKAWLILDKRLVKQALREVSGGKARAFQRDLARLNIWLGSKKSLTLVGLAAKIGIPLAPLEQQIADYNRAAKAQDGSDRFEKSDADLAVLEGPFYAIDISIDARLFPCPALTLGGLVVDQSTGQVLAEKDNQPIGGLYAAGRNAIGVCSENYLSGLSIADCVYSGRRAARNIAERNIA